MHKYSQVVQLSDTILMWVFGVLCIGAALMSLLLWYHWTRYSMKDPIISFTQIVYFLGLFVLILTTLTLLL